MSTQPPTQAMPPQPPQPGGPGGTGTGAPTPPSRGPWIIAGAIVLVGIIVVIVMVLLLKDDTPEPEPSPSASPSQSESPSPSPSPTRTRSPRPSPSASPSPSPSPTVDNATLVRQVVQDAAEADRPGEVKHVGSVDFYKNPSCATREGAQATVRYTSPEKVAIWLTCANANGRWKIHQGPIYGE